MAGGLGANKEGVGEIAVRGLPGDQGLQDLPLPRRQPDRDRSPFGGKAGMLDVSAGVSGRNCK